MNVTFSSGPGHFSPLTQVAVQEGIKASALAAGLDESTWDVFLTFPYPGITVYGESLSAAVSLAVLAMANHNPLLANRVITGKITPDGHIGAVGGIPLKIQAAYTPGHNRSASSVTKASKVRLSHSQRRVLHFRIQEVLQPCFIVGG